MITEHTSVTFRTNDLRKAIPMVRASTSDNVEQSLRLKGIRNVRRPYQEPSMPKMRSNDVLADHRAGTSGFRFADFRMPEMLRHRNLRGVDFPRNKCLYRASLAGSRAASALAFGISGNTAASIAMTASRFLGNGCGNRGLLQIMRMPNPSEAPFSSRNKIRQFV